MLSNKFKPPARASEIRYVIREITLEAEKYEKTRGEKTISLNIGDPCKYDFSPPQHIVDAYIEALRSGKHYYSDSRGEYELREAVVEYEKRKNGLSLSPDDVLITQGAAEAVNVILAAAFEPGDKLLVPSPTYPPYITAARFFGVEAAEYMCLENEDWIPDIDHMRRLIDSKTKAILVINPNNPTGAVYTPKIIRNIIDLAGEYNLYVISDEIYDLIVFDGQRKAPNTASLAKDVPVITIYSLSKAYLATGWRVGYMYKYDPNNLLDDLWAVFTRFLMTRLSANTPAQYAAKAALLGPQDNIKIVVDKLERRRDLVYRRFNEIDEIEARKPKGAFYIFPKINLNIDDNEFCKKLLWNTGIVVPPGSGFGSFGKQHFRVVFLPPEHILNEALDRIERFMKEIAK